MKQKIVDGVIRRTPSSAAVAPDRQRAARPRGALPVSPLPPAAPVPQQSRLANVQRRSFAAPQPLRRRRRWYAPFILPAAVIGCMSASFLMQSQRAGIAAIAVYGVVAWVRRVPSRTSFIMGFLSLLAVIALLVIKQNVQLAGNFATYTFLLLVIGTAASVRESQAYPKHRNSKILNLRRKSRL